MLLAKDHDSSNRLSVHPADFGGAAVAGRGVSRCVQHRYLSDRIDRITNRIVSYSLVDGLECFFFEEALFGAFFAATCFRWSAALVTLARPWFPVLLDDGEAAGDEAGGVVAGHCLHLWPD